MKLLFKQRGYNLLSDKYIGNKSPLVFERDGYKYQNTYNGFIKTDNPKKWGINNPFSMENLALWLQREGSTCNLLSDKYDNEYIELRCECGEIYHVSMSNLITKRQFKCPKCGRLSSAKKNNQKDRFMKVIESKGLRIIGEYSTAKERYYMMTHDGYYIKTSPWNIEAGINERDTIFDVCNKYSLVNMQRWLDNNHVELKILSKEYNGAKSRYMFRCNCGKVFSVTWQSITLGGCTRCPSCSNSISSIELKTKKWLDENAVCYVQQKTFDECRDKALLRFDFYLPDYDALIEVDGSQHFHVKASWGRTEEEAVQSYNGLKRRDAIKNKFCADTNRRLLRIPYWEYETNQYKKTLKAFTAKI